MKDFFKNKTNAILSVTLLILIVVGVLLGMMFLKDPEVKAVDFSNMSEQEITDWATENNVIDKFEFKHEFDENTPEGGIVYYSLKEGEVIADKVLIIVSDGKDTSDQLEIPIDSNTTQETIETWFKENNFINVVYETVDSAEYTAGHVISVDPIKAAPTDKVIVKIAGGQLIEVPDFSFYSDSEITKWSKENNIKIVYAEEVSKTVKEGNFIKQSIAAGKSAAVGSTITITLSSGDGSVKTVYIDPYKYLGYTEADFTKALKELGYTNLKKLDAVFSSKQKKDTICYYLPDGNQKVTTEISYKLSLGAFDVSSFNGKTKAEGEELLKSAKSSSAKVETLKTTETETTDTTKQGKLYDCSLSSTTITCKLGKSGTTETGKTATIPTNLYGNSVTEATFKSKLNELGFTNLQKVNIYSSGTVGTVRAYDPDGKQDTGTTIKYAVSIGSFNAADYKGLTAAKAQEKVDTLNVAPTKNITLVTNETTTADYTAGTVYDCKQTSNGYFNQTITCKLAKSSTTPVEEKVTLANYVGQSSPCGSNSTCSLNNINFTVTEEYSSSVASGKVISQSVAAGQVAEGTNVTLKVSKGEKTAYIDKASAYRSGCAETVEGTKTYMNGILGEFSITYQTETSQSYGVGKIISMSVNGNEQYSGDYYPVSSTTIVIKISSGYSS